MMSLLTAISWCLVVPAAALYSVIIVEMILGVWPSRKKVELPGNFEPVTILIPAHNEEAVIASTLASLTRQQQPNISILVIADNCSDETARIARECGVAVLERHDPDFRGKGHALAFGRDAMKIDPPNCVIVLDADCTISPESIELLAFSVDRWAAPVQANNLIYAALDKSAKVQISNFAFLVKNSIRRRACARLGVPATLSGTGMAFPWSIFSKAQLATSNIVEDLQLGIELTRTGKWPHYLEQAQVWSKAADEGDTLTQRTRWEHGYVQTAVRHGLPMVGLGLSRLSPRLLWFGLDLLVPPLALLLTIGIAILLVTGGLAIIGGQVKPAMLLAALISATAVGLFAAWLSEGRKTIGLRTLLHLPAYVLWKIPIYFKLLYKRQAEWVRTGRSAEDVPD